MKTLLTILFAAILSVSSAQTVTIGTPRACAPVVTVDCNLIATASVNVANINWLMRFSQGQTSTTVPVNPDGLTFNLGAVLSGVDYTVSYDNGFSSGCGASTYFIAVAGRTVQDGTSGSVTYTDTVCPGASPTAAKPANPTRKPRKHGKP